MIWLNALQATIEKGRACVLVTIRDVQGSAPRSIGSRMLVAIDSVADTIGGGALEQQAIDYGRVLIKNAAKESTIESKQVILGAELSQCCGGKVTLTYEYHPACSFNIVVFGAGHVAQSLAIVLQQLPCRALFIDSRDEWLAKLPTSESNYGVIATEKLGKNPFLVVERCPDHAYFLVMTHCHELDFDLVEAILSRGDSRYCGLIASKSKAASFRNRLARKGFTETELAKLTAPIGADQRNGNLPMEVAIATVSELLKIRRQQLGEIEQDTASDTLTTQTL